MSRHARDRLEAEGTHRDQQEGDQQEGGEQLGNVGYISDAMLVDIDGKTKLTL